MKRSDNFQENLEQTQESVQRPKKAAAEDVARVRELGEELVEQLQALPEGDQIGQIVENALKLLRDKTNRGDIKLINKSLKEIRYALKVFAPYRQIRKISIFGSARTPPDHPDYKAAADFARGMVENGWMVITGAGGGIMAAGHGGAGAEPSFGLAIRLPFEQATNVHIANDPKLINFKYFFTRKLMFVRSANALALFPGGVGTLDEGFEVLTLVQTGKSVPMPIVMVEHPGGTYWQGWLQYVRKHLLGEGYVSDSDFHLFKICSNNQEAIDHITHFYSNYHSVRTVRDELVIRLHRRPTEQQLKELEQRYADINLGGRFRISGPLPLEADEPDLDHLHRLVFRFNRRDQGRLRQLIDDLNDL